MKSYPILFYPPGPILSYPILLYIVLFHPILLYIFLYINILSYSVPHIVSYPVLSQYLAPSYPSLSYSVLSFPFLFYVVLSNQFLSCPILFHIPFFYSIPPGSPGFSHCPKTCVSRESGMLNWLCCVCVCPCHGDTLPHAHRTQNKVHATLVRTKRLQKLKAWAYSIL